MISTSHPSPQHLGWWRGHHPLVWWITGVAVAFSLAFSILGPFYRAPDERNHVDMVKYYGSSLGFPDPRMRVPIDPGVLASTRLVLPPRDSELGGARPPLSADQAQPRHLRPTFQELAETQGSAANSRSNHLTQHPPFYYVLVSSAGSLAGAALPQEAWSWDREVWLYRLISVVLIAPLPVLASTAAGVLDASPLGRVMASAVLLLIPMLSYIGAVVNNDATMILGAAIAVSAGLVHLKHPSCWSAAVAAGGAAVAAWSKSTGATLLPWVMLVVFVAAIPAWRAGRRGEALKCFGLASVITLGGAGWHLRNVIRFADPQPTSSQRNVIEDAETPLGPFLQTWYERVAGTFWGQPGRRTGVTLADWLVTSLTVAVVLAAAAMVIVAVRRRRHRTVVFLLGMLWIVQVALLLRTTLAHYMRTGRYAAMQGRYLYAALVPLAVLLGLFVVQVVPRRARAWVVAAAIAAGAAVHLILARSMLNGFWAGDGVVDRVRSVLAWSPLPDGVGLVFLALPLVGIGWMAVAILRTTMRESRVAEVFLGDAMAKGTAPGLTRQAAVATGVTVVAGAMAVGGLG